MCISARASINSFTLNLFSVICLIYFGNKELRVYNIIIGCFAIFTSLMQLVDLGIWLDLDGKKGINKICTLIGPILNHFQPLVLFGVAYYILNKTHLGKNINKVKNLNYSKTGNIISEQIEIKNKKMNATKIINLIYLLVIIVLLYRYYKNKFVKSNNTICKLTDGYIKWNWLDNNSNDIIVLSIVYIFVVSINILGINPKSKYIIIALILYMTSILPSYSISKKHSGELWCYISNCIPLILLVIQKIFKQIN